MGQDDFEVSDLALTPRILENAITLYREMQNERKDFQRKGLETIMPKEKVASFLSYLDEIKNIGCVDVINGVKKEKIADLMKNNRIDILSTITSDLGDIFYKYEMGKSKVSDLVEGVKVKENDALVNVANYLNDVPSEITTMFIDLLKDKYDDQKTCFLFDKKVYDIVSAKLKKYKKVISDSKTSTKP